MLDYIEYIKKNNLGEIKTNKTFKDITTLKIGGSIDLLFYPSTIENFIIFYKYYLKNEKYPIIIIGNGSNVLASSDEYKGIVVSFKKINYKYSLVKNIVTVSSGVLINDLINFLKNNNLSGLEKLYYIPATIGGLLKMNGSAYGNAISDNLIYMKVIDENGSIKIINKEEIEFSDCSETVINKCIQDAEQKGYALAVEMIEEGVYKMTFTYNYKAMFFDAGKDVNIVGYAKGGVL